MKNDQAAIYKIVVRPGRFKPAAGSIALWDFKPIGIFYARWEFTCIK